LGFIAIKSQTQTKKKLESVAKQRFQVFSWFGFERKAANLSLHKF
jgi:hypothetical protein